MHLGCGQRLSLRCAVQCGARHSGCSEPGVVEPVSSHVPAGLQPAFGGEKAFWNLATLTVVVLIVREVSVTTFHL